MIYDVKVTYFQHQMSICFIRLPPRKSLSPYLTSFAFESSIPSSLYNVNVAHIQLCVLCKHINSTYISLHLE